MATVLVKMPVCDKTHKVTVTMRDDGDMDVQISSDCINVQEYGRDLEKLSFADLGSITTSRIMDPLLVEHFTPTCMAPVAVFNAGWLEAGLISRSLFKKVGASSMEYQED